MVLNRAKHHICMYLKIFHSGYYEELLFIAFLFGQFRLASFGHFSTEINLILHMI